MSRVIATTAVAALGLVSQAAAARPPVFEMAYGDVPRELAGADSAIVVANCSGCHSLDYITTQPRGKGEKFWHDSVTKMATVYKASISADDATKVAAILARKFG